MDWHHPDESYSTNYLASVVISFCNEYCPPDPKSEMKVVDLGCGNGAMTKRLFDAGFERIVGIDSSESGIAFAKKRVPKGDFQIADFASDVPQEMQNAFDIAVSTEVIEHLYSPARLLTFARQVLKPAGVLILSTPYHGYLKNLAIALTNSSDRHYQPLYEGGHIKFWSKRNLESLLSKSGFSSLKWRGVGRLPPFWKSIIVVARLNTVTSIYRPPIERPSDATGI